METENKTITEYLKCLLTEDESREAGSVLARKYSEIQELEEQKKSVTSDFKGRIDSATAEAARIARIIQNGYEFRHVECEVVQDFEEKTIRLIRLDTGEIVKERAMSANELQKELFDGEEE